MMIWHPAYNLALFQKKKTGNESNFFFFSLSFYHLHYTYGMSIAIESNYRQQACSENSTKYIEITKPFPMVLFDCS